MSAKKIVKKRTAKKVKTVTTKGYKGHRPGSAKEKIHQLFDKFGAEKARPMAEKLLKASTVQTSFSQFRNADK
jgi:hypothetical protein